MVPKGQRAGLAGRPFLKGAPTRRRYRETQCSPFESLLPRCVGRRRLALDVISIREGIPGDAGQENGRDRAEAAFRYAWAFLITPFDLMDPGAPLSKEKAVAPMNFRWIAVITVRDCAFTHLDERPLENSTQGGHLALERSFVISFIPWRRIKIEKNAVVVGQLRTLRQCWCAFRWIR